MWYRVVGSGLSGAARRSIDDAWRSYYRNGRVAYGYRPDEYGTAVAAHSARLVQATTKRAAESADVSAARGTVGRGRWWLVLEEVA